MRFSNVLLLSLAVLVVLSFFSFSVEAKRSDSVSSRLEQRLSLGRRQRTGAFVSWVKQKAGWVKDKVDDFVDWTEDKLKDAVSLLVYEAVIKPYILVMRTKGAGNKKSLSTELKTALKAASVFPSVVNLDNIRYYVNTWNHGGSGNAVTFDDEMFYNANPTFETCRELHWLLHEMTHTLQCKRVGGMVGFTRRVLGGYSKSALKEFIRNGGRGFDVDKWHDDVHIETEADCYADKYIKEFLKQMNAGRPANKQISDSSCPTARSADDCSKHSISF